MVRREITYKHNNHIIPAIAIHAAYDGQVPESGNIQNVLSTIYTLWFIQHGEVELKSPGRQWQVGAGNWIIVTPGMERSQSFSSGCRILSVHFSFEQIFLHQFLTVPEIHVFPEAQLAGLKAITGRFIATFEQTFKVASSRPLSMMIEYKAMEYRWFSRLFSLLVRRGVFPDQLSGVDARIEAAIDYLEKSDHGINVPYDELEKVCGLSRVQIDRLFKEQLEVSPKRICDRITLARAMRLLSDHNINCKEAGYRLHFVTIPHFCHWFRQHSGLTPDQFRKSLNC